MTPEIILRYLHFISIFAIVSTIVAEHLLLKKELTRAEIGRLSRVDAVYGIAALVLLAVIVGDGSFALYSLIAAGGFLSVLFPTVFGLAIEDLNDFTEHGSALLNIMIVGGAVFPPLQGVLADQWGVNVSYIVPVICIGVVTLYGIVVSVGGKRLKVES